MVVSYFFFNLFPSLVISNCFEGVLSFSILSQSSPHYSILRFKAFLVVINGVSRFPTLSNLSPKADKPYSFIVFLVIFNSFKVYDASPCFPKHQVKLYALIVLYIILIAFKGPPCFPIPSQAPSRYTTLVVHSISYYFKC